LASIGFVVHPDHRSVSDTAVQPDAVPLRQGELGGDSGDVEPVQRAALRLPACRGVLGVEADLDRVPTRRRRILRQPSAFGDAHLQRHEVQPGGALGNRVLDLQAGVHLEEEELAAVGGEELDGPRADVVDRLGRRARCGEQFVPHRRVDQRRRRLLDDLLVAALDRAFALPHRPDGAVGVDHHLYLDVAPRVEVSLAEHGRIAERGRGLRLRALHGLGQLGQRPDHAHPPATAACGRLHQHRQICLGDLRGLQFGQDRYPGLGHEALGLHLRAHGLDGVRWRSDPDQPGIEHGPGEGRVLGEEAVPGVHSVGPGLQCGRDHQIRAQVGLRRRVPR
jgi:hypothetical protein